MNQLVQYKDNTNVGPAGNVSSIGSGGLFSKVAQDPVISALVGIRTGFDSVLPVLPSRIENPVVNIITGITDASAASGADCNKFPTAGSFKVCYINNYPFGKYGMKSQSVNLSDVNLVDNNWTNQQQAIVGNPFNSLVDPKTSTIPGSATAQQAYAMAAQNDAMKVMAEMFMSASTEYGRTMLYGNPDDNDYTNDIRFARGLSLLINDNYSDFVTGVDCARVDSKVVDFSGKSVEANTNELVSTIIDILALFDTRVTSMGLQGRWDGYLVMHPDLFRKLVFAWPATFASYRTALNTSTEARVDAMLLQQQRMDMINGGYLITDTGNVPVVTDISITQSESMGTYTSDIFFINRRVNSRPTAYVEYVPMNETALPVARQFGAVTKFNVLDNGKFLTYWQTEGVCVRANMLYRSRLRIDTPFLCGRIDSVSYTPNMVINETPYPSDAGYINGGVTGPYAGAEGTIVEITACADVGAGELTFTVDQPFDCGAAGGVQVVLSSGTIIPGVVSAGAGTTSVTVDFTTAATPAFLQAITCADFTFVGATLRCPYQNA